jgi:hypothetical protein
MGTYIYYQKYYTRFRAYVLKNHDDKIVWYWWRIFGRNLQPFSGRIGV